MDLSQSQLAAIDAGEPVHMLIEGRKLVLLPNSMYEELRGARDEWHPSTMRRHMASMMQDDWSDPAMSVYDE